MLGINTSHRISGPTCPATLPSPFASCGDAQCHLDQSPSHLPRSGDNSHTLKCSCDLVVASTLCRYRESRWACGAAGLGNPPTSYLASHQSATARELPPEPSNSSCLSNSVTGWCSEVQQAMSPSLLRQMASRAHSPRKAAKPRAASLGLFVGLVVANPLAAVCKSHDDT